MEEIRIFNGRPADLGGRSEAETAVYGLLDNLGIDYATACHEAAFTMEQCAAVEEALGAPICKNLFLCTHNKSGVYLLMMPGDNDSGHRVRLIIDRDLLALTEFGCHPCVNTATLRLRMKDFLERYLPAVSHEPALVELPAL